MKKNKGKKKINLFDADRNVYDEVLEYLMKNYRGMTGFKVASKLPETIRLKDGRAISISGAVPLNAKTIYDIGIYIEFLPEA